MRPVELPGAVADPDQVGTRVVPAARRAIDPGQRLLVAQEQGLVAGEERGAGDLGRAEVGDPAGAHEVQRLGDPARHVAVALALRAAVEEAHGPLVDAGQRGIAALGEGAQQVERGRRLRVGLELPARVGLARGRLELDRVDDVAAVARQDSAADLLHVGRAGLGELARHPAQLHDGQAGAEGEDDRHLQEHAQGIADLVGGEVGKGLGTVAALEDEALACAHLGQLVLERPALAREHERRIARQAPLHVGEDPAVGIGRDLVSPAAPPAVGLPVAYHDRSSSEARPVPAGTW